MIFRRINNKYSVFKFHSRNIINKYNPIIKDFHHIELFTGRLDFKSMGALGLKVGDRQIPSHADFLEKFRKGDTNLDISLTQFNAVLISKNTTNKWGKETINME